MLLRDTAFPPFAAALLDVGTRLESFRVGTTDACPSPPRLFTSGGPGGDIACDFEGENAWIESSSADVAGEFACVGDLWRRQQGEDTTCRDGADEDEQPALTAAAVVGSEEYGTIVRDDALLVVIAITDEDEALQDVDDVDAIYDQLVSLKPHPQEVVFLGIGGREAGCDGTYGRVSKRAEALINLTDRFREDERGFFGDLCTERLEDVFVDALEVIQQACEELPYLI